MPLVIAKRFEDHLAHFLEQIGLMTNPPMPKRTIWRSKSNNIQPVKDKVWDEIEINWPVRKKNL